MKFYEALNFAVKLKEKKKKSSEKHNKARFPYRSLLIMHTPFVLKEQQWKEWMAFGARSLFFQGKGVFFRFLFVYLF